MSEPTRPPAQSPANATGHGSIRLIESKCTSCMICVRECPTWCIHIDSHNEGRHNVLDAFAIDWSLCMYCGICIEECPFDALEWAGDHVPASPTRTGLVQQREQLRTAGLDPSGSASPAEAESGA